MKSIFSHFLSLGAEGDPARILEKVYSGYLLRIATQVERASVSFIQHDRTCFGFTLKNPLDKLLEGFLPNHPRN
jgi:hypothetical protein